MNDTEIWLQPGIFNNDLSGSIILTVKNLSSKDIKIEAGTFLATITIAPVLYPKLFPLSTIEMLVKGGITPSEILTKESLKDLEIGSLEDCLIALEENYPNLDLRELTEVENPDPYSDRIHQSVRLSNVELVQVPSIPPNFEKTLKNEMPSSSDHLKLADGHLTAVHSQKRAKIYYSLCDPEGCHPRCSYSSPGIDLPLQETLVLEPSMRVLCDTKLKFLIMFSFFQKNENSFDCY